jgi:glutamate carboxypeptidase
MAGNQADRILNYVQDQRIELVELLRTMVQAESPSSYPDSHIRIGTILTEQLRALDFKVVPLGGGSTGRHIYARPEPKTRGAPAQLMIGHYDTVWPIGTIAERPFSVDGNVARGPGVFDMKGGIAQMIFALKALRALDLCPELTPVVFVNSDEEIGSRDSGRFIRQLARRVDRTFVLEPAMGASGIIKTERKGIGRFTITVHGKAAHAGLDPDAGASAILELSHVIQTLFALNEPDSGITINVGTINGGIQPNVIAAHSRAVIDVRVPSESDGNRIEKAIHGIEPSTPGVRLTIEGRIGRPAMAATPRNRALWQRAQHLGRDLGMELRHGRAGGGSDGNTTSQYTATLDGLGPVGDGAHAEHEFLYIDKTLERTALLALLLLSPPVQTAEPEEPS